MSTDLKIELFGEDLFKYLYEHHGIREKPSKGKKHPPRKSEFTEKIFRAVQVRMAMCHYTYEGIIENTHWEFSGNWSDFFDTIVFQFPHYVDWKRNPSPEMAMSVFLYSCAFVADMVLWSRMKGDNFLYVGPKAWAMFVDLYMKKEFYARGGWKKLHKFVEHDTVVHDYMKTFSEEVDCVLGKAFMFHTPFLTCGAVDSFDEFEASLEGVDDDAPMALKWVDYCVKVPFTKIRDSKFYYPSDSDVFLKLETAMLDLGYILNPDREGDYFEGDSDAAGSPKTKADARRKSQTTRIQSKCRKETTSDFPIAPVGRFDTEPPTQGIDDDYYSDGENIRAINPENMLKPGGKTYTDPQHIVRLAVADRMCSMMAGKNPAQNTEVVSEKIVPSKSSAVADHEKCDQAVAVRALQWVLELMDSKRKKTLKASVSKHDDSNLSKIDSKSHIQSSSSDKNECLIQQTTLSDNKVDLDKSSEEEESGLSIGIVITPNDHNDTEIKINTNQNDFDTVTEPMEPEKFSEYAPSDSRRRVDLYLKTVELDNSAKSPLTSTNINVLSTPRKSPLTSPNITVLSTPDGILYKRIDTSDLSGSSRKSPAGKETSPSSISKAEMKKKSPRQKNFKVYSISPNSSKGTDVQELKIIQEGKYPVIDSFCPSQLYLDIDDPSKDKKSLLDEKTYGLNPEQLKIKQEKIEKIKNIAKTNKGIKKYNINVLKSFLKSPSSDPMWSGLDVRHQSSVLINDDVENDHILEKSLKLLEPAGKKDLSRPSKEREYGLGDRRISHDNSHAEIYQVNERENSSGDSTVENKFKLTPGAAVEKTNKTEIPVDCGKPLKTENEMTTAETTDENPIGIDGKKAKKKKSKNELNFDDSNKEALQTSQSENTTAEPVLEHPLGLSSEPQDAGKKVKKKKKLISRLEQRVKEEGDCVHDVTRLILVMGHQPGMESVASAFHNSKKQTPKDDNQNEK